MAKLSVTVPVLFILLTVSQARIPSITPENDVIDRELSNSLPDSDVSSNLRLPSDSVNEESHSNELAGDMPESEQITVRSIPLRFVRFHPSDRRFPIRSRFPFRNCRHHHRHHPFFKPIRQQQQHVEIPYGDDMILATGENSDFDSHRDFDPVMFHHGGIRRIPARWVRFHDHHDDDEDGFSKFVLKHSRIFGKDKFKKHLHHKDHEKEIEEEEREEKKEEEGGGFVKRIRKFLDRYHV